jgi:hypothetical protein
MFVIVMIPVSPGNTKWAAMFQHRQIVNVGCEVPQGLAALSF